MMRIQRMFATGEKNALDEDLFPLVRLWVLRMLVPLGAQQKFIERDGFCSESVADLLGLAHFVHDATFEKQQVRDALVKAHREAEATASRTRVPDILHRNITRLAQLVGLSQTDCRLLEFVVILHIEQMVEDVSDMFGYLSAIKAYRLLAGVLALPERQVKDALSTNGVLLRSGLLSLDRRNMSQLRGKTDLLSHNFADYIYSSEVDPVELLRGTVAVAASPQLQIDDYQHVRPALDILIPYVRNSLRAGRKGVNIFLHGAPGTGKSQLVKVLAHEFGCELFEVASEDDDGDPIEGAARLRAYRAAQCFFAARRSLILFDEVEDVFDDGDNLFGRKSTAQTRKAWINRVLEQNVVPTVWVSNSIRGIDPAFIRRFDMMLELPVPPRKQRERLIHSACGQMLTEPEVSRIAKIDTLAPAIVARAASVVHEICEDLGPGKASAAMELLIGNTLEAQGRPPLRVQQAEQLSEIYDPAFVQADADLAAISQGLLRAKSGRLCLYGPPGTGKTAYGYWLAEQFDMPLLLKRASDLQSMWVGQSEKNIAGAFAEAEADGALLLIDEVDSFLQDRRGASRSWEVSLVNEMLTQMEAFNGLFIASTNLMSGLDQAALRRFDLKVRFDFLDQAKTRNLFLRHCEMLGLDMPASDLLRALQRLDRLTPGDFAAVRRQHRFRPVTSAQSLLAALQGEQDLKEASRPAIGFV